MIELCLYGTSGCHLCEVAEGLLASVVDFSRVQIELIDIADSDPLLERYGVRIPVLAEPRSGAELGWPFDAGELTAFLAQFTAPA